MNDNITAVLGEDGILVATIDMPGRSMNVFSDDLMDALEGVLDTVSSQTSIIGAVFVSGKSAFLVGADLAMVRRFTERALLDSTESLHAMCGRLGRLFRRLETCGKPFVAAIHGLALGGGLELALACNQRIASDDRGTQLGLPEIKLGLLPGAGGTQRLPRLAGTAAAFQLLLSGEPVSAQRALKLGIVDEVVAENALMTAARQRVLRLAKATTKAPWDRTGWRPPLNSYDFDALEVASAIAEAVGINDGRFTHYPAYEAIIESVIGGWLKPMDDACRWEMDCFVQLIRNPVAGNLVRTLFLNRQRATKTLGRGVPGRSRQLGVRGTVTGGLAETLEQAGVLIIPSMLKDEAEIAILTDPGHSASKRSDLAWLRGAAPFESFSTDFGLWVSDATEYGRAVEICSRGSSVTPNHAALDIVRWLNAVPLFTREGSLLQSLESIQVALLQFTGEERLLAVALQAARIWCLGGIEDVELADVATVVAGFAPAYTGGLFAYLRQRGPADVGSRAKQAEQCYGAQFDVPKGCDALWSTRPNPSA